MIKKILFGLLAFVGFGLSFSIAGYEGIVGQFKPSEYNSQLQINVLKKGSFLTQYLGTTKDVFLVNNDIFFLRGPDGRLYTHFYYVNMNGNYRYFEGYMPKYCSCDEFTGGVLLPSNCSCFAVDPGTVEIYSNFLKTVDSNDWYYYNYNQPYNDTMRFDLCISSSSLHSSLCWLNSCDMYGSCNGLYGNELNFGNNVNFSQLNGYPSPAVTSNPGSTDSNINVVVTGDIVEYSCTWKDLFILFESEGYNKYICYGGLNNFDLYDSSLNYNPIPGQGLSISQIWAWSGSRAWDNFTDWFNFWNGLYFDYDVSGDDYVSMWESYPAVYRTYFKLYNTYRNGILNPDLILNYCQSLDVYTGDLLNSSVGGQFNSLCETVVREKQTGVRDSRVDGSIYSEGVYTGNVPLSVNWGTGKTYSDGTTFIQDFYNNLRSKLNYGNNGSNGIIPTYILVFLFVIIFFKFIRK